MIPRLAAWAPADALHRDFLDALRGRGFRGDTTVRDADRLTFATDNSIYRIEPKAIVFPRTAGNVEALMRLIVEPRFAGVAIAARGGATGTNGHSLTTGIVIDVSRYMTDILEINVEECWV